MRQTQNGDPETPHKKEPQVGGSTAATGLPRAGQNGIGYRFQNGNSTTAATSHDASLYTVMT